MKRWKRGQLVTINRKVFRVTENNTRHFTCCLCDIFHTECGTFLCDKHIPIKCYLKEVKPKATIG